MIDMLSFKTSTTQIREDYIDSVFDFPMSSILFVRLEILIIFCSVFKCTCLF